MESFNETLDEYVERFAFIEALSREFIGMTGCGVYALLSPSTVDQLFNKYLELGVSVRTFARQFAMKMV
jgi:hypothetical protein